MSEDSVSSVSPIENTTNIKRKPVSTTVFSNLPPSQPSQFDEQTSKTNYEPNYEPVTDGSKDGPLNRRHRRQSKVPQPVWLWKWEILSLVAATAALIAIIITLRVFENKDLKHWKVPITINAVVAILSALFKGGLALPISDGIGQLKWLWFYRRPQSLADMDRYDRASRSTWGAIVFLATSIHRVTLSPLAVFGAFLALLTLIVDPFIQASVSTQSCTHSEIASNLIPLTTNYSVQVSTIEGIVQDLPAGMQIAALTGLNQPPRNTADSMQSKVRCLGSNCTYTEADEGVFNTLTMCHQCKDVTDVLEKRERNFKAQPVGALAEEVVQETTYSYNPRQRNSSDAAYCTMKTQNVTLQYAGRNRLIPTDVACHADGSGGVDNRTFADGPWLDTTVTSLCGIFMTKKNITCNAAMGMGSCEQMPFAFDCALQPCVKAFRANFSQGTYREQQVGSWPLHAISNVWNENTFQLGLNQTYVNGTLRDCNPQAWPSDTHSVRVDVPDNQHAQLEFQLRYLWYPQECVYVMKTQTVTTLAGYLAKQINNQNLTLAQGFVENTPLTGPPWLSNLFNKGVVNITAANNFAEGLATSIGAFVRTDPDRVSLFYNGSNELPSSAGKWLSAPGQVHNEGTCIRVRWKFLSFPAILLVAELIFFIALVIVNWRSKWSGDWKSSNVPLMFQDAAVKWPVSHSDLAVSDELHLHKEMSGVQARLIQDNNDSGRWKLSTSAESNSEK